MSDVLTVPQSKAAPRSQKVVLAIAVYNALCRRFVAVPEPVAFSGPDLHADLNATGGANEALWRTRKQQSSLLLPVPSTMPVSLLPAAQAPLLCSSC